MALEQIGQKLKSARESQSLSLSQVYDKTKIPLEHLQALELGRADDLPEQVYVTGFIRRYGDLVGLNGQTLVEEFKRSMQQESSGRGGLFGGGRTTTAPSSSTMAPVTYVTKTRVDAEAPGFGKTFFYPALLVISTIGVVCGLAQWYQSQMANQNDPGVEILKRPVYGFDKNGQPIAVTGGPNQGSQVANGLQNNNASATEAKVSLSASQHVWLEVTAMSSGAPLFSGYLERGDRRDFQDAQGLRIRAGNGASVTVDYQGNNETFGPAGKPLTREFANPTYSAAQNNPTGANTTASATGTLSTAASDVKPAIVKKPVLPRKVADDSSSGRRGGYRRIEGVSRDVPADSGRSIDVPYRYTD